MVKTRLHYLKRRWYKSSRHAFSKSVLACSFTARQGFFPTFAGTPDFLSLASVCPHLVCFCPRRAVNFWWSPLVLLQAVSTSDGVHLSSILHQQSLASSSVWAFSMVAASHLSLLSLLWSTPSLPTQWFGILRPCLAWQCPPIQVSSGGDVE